MRIRSFILAFAILILLVIPSIFAMGAYLNVFSNPSSHFLSSSSGDPAYSESLNLYVTSAQSMWIATLTGGIISLGVTIPSSVSSFNVSLTYYNSWNSQYEVFTKYGFGYLGPEEPMPNATLLTIYTTSQSDASTLASTLGQKFALNFVPFSTTSSSYTFVSPMDFSTEMHIYFWNLLPANAGGFANMTTQAAFDSQSLAFYYVDYNGTYSISYGGISSLTSSSPFTLYSQLGISGTLNYSSVASSSSVAVHVLGGLVANSTSSFQNYKQTLSALLSAPTVSLSNSTVPDLNATLDFSFPTIVAYRQISPLDPASNTNVTVSVTVDDVSPSTAPNATVTFNDNWYKSYDLTESGTSSATYNLTSGVSDTAIYFLKMPNVSSPTAFTVPAIPVTYSFMAANGTVSTTIYLNTETLLVGAGSTSAAAVETYEISNSTAISAGQPPTFNVFVKNWGPGPATSVTVAGQSSVTIDAGAAQNFTVTGPPSTLTQTNAIVTTAVSWYDGYNYNGTTGSGAHNESTNTVSAVYSFGSPSSPDTTLSKSISVSSNKASANITLTLTNSGTQSLSNLTVFDPIPSGIKYGNSVGNVSSSITLGNTSSGVVNLAVANVSAGASISYEYNVTIHNADYNYVFSPANVSVNWDGVTIVHFSQGAGIPLGVSATKSLSPSAGFQGTSGFEKLSISNSGTLPVYDVSYANSTDTFLTYINSTSGVTPVLGSGSTLNATLNVNMTGASGTYNSSAFAASFIFAGTNQTAPSNVFRVTIYQVLAATLSTSSPKIEEDHDITITVTVDNPSNVTVSGVNYSTKLPSYLNYVAGNLTFTINSLGPNQSMSNSFTFKTGIPYSYTIPGGNLTFQYQSKTLKGMTTPLTLNISDDLTLRYAIPVFVGLLIVIGTVFYVRRLVRKPTS